MNKALIDRALLIAVLAAVGAQYWQLVNLTARLGGVEARLTELDNRLFSVEGRVFLVQEQLSELENQFVIAENVMVDPGAEPTPDP